MENHSKIYVAGHRGLVGSAIVRRLRQAGYSNIVCRAREELDLRDRNQVKYFFESERPEYVFLAAARVGGILANRDAPVEFLQDNLAIQSNVMEAAYKTGCRKLLFLGSSCIYPKFAPQPMREEYLLTGALEPTNEPYAIAKIAGIKLAQAYRRQYGFPTICLMPTNLYGPGDNFDLQTSHVVPALIRKFYEATTNQANQVYVWGTGRPRREFLHVDDLADAAVFLMLNYDEEEIINVGVGKDISIRELAEMIADIASYSGEIVFDATKPDGTPRKLLDVTRITRLGWRPKIDMRYGLESTYQWYVNHVRSSGIA